MVNKHYQFKLIHHGYAISLKINDVVIEQDPDGVFTSREFFCNQFIINGENKVVLDLSLPGIPPELPKDLTLSLELFEINEADLNSGTKPKALFKLEFPGDQPPQFPASVETTFMINSPFGRWDWENAAPVETVTPEITDACGKLLERMHHLLKDKNYSAIQTLTQTKTIEMAKSFYIPMADRLSDQKEFFDGIFNDSQFAMEPLALEKLTITRMAYGKILLLQQNDGQPILESKELSEGYCFSLPVYVSYIGNDLVVVR